MPDLTVSTELAATPEEVWQDISDIGSHVEWMHDAAAIRFTSDSDSGVGTTFECDTRVGPFRLTDRMEITSWVPAKEMGVRHSGIVTGSGVFTLRPTRDAMRAPEEASTTFVWRERLSFPWYLGGPIGAAVARPVLRLVWKKNLSNLAARFER